MIIEVIVTHKPSHPVFMDDELMDVLKDPSTRARVQKLRDEYEPQPINRSLCLEIHQKIHEMLSKMSGVTYLGHNCYEVTERHNTITGRIVEWNVGGLTPGDVEVSWEVVENSEGVDVPLLRTFNLYGYNDPKGKCVVFSPGELDEEKVFN